MQLSYPLPCLSVLLLVGSSLAANAPFQPRQDHLPVAPPSDARVLFDGEKANEFVNMNGGPIDWPTRDHTLVVASGGSRANHIVSRIHFRDADIHVEFMLPGKGPGNSGVYLHGNYEMQIINSFGKKRPDLHDMGALYGFQAPLVNACRRPEEWQVYDIRYRAPRRDAQGTIVEQGTIAAWLNGQKVQDDVGFGEPRSPYHPFRYGTTPYLQAIAERQKATGVGPLFLQDHGAPMRFRNVWIVPLDDKVLVYRPTE